MLYLPDIPGGSCGHNESCWLARSVRGQKPLGIQAALGTDACLRPVVFEILLACCGVPIFLELIRMCWSSARVSAGRAQTLLRCHIECG
ncbi:hypothetical protein AB672_05270 [Xylella taiwanensis]|nr:hypothetical protein AB672_05270 [Xylella taiwanensis]